MPDIWRLLSVTWQGVPVASLAVFLVGGLMYVAMSRSTSIRPSPAAMRIRRPGWIARRRARAGIGHSDDKVGIGYTSALRSVHLSLRELADHGSVFGGPDSGKALALDTPVPTPHGWTTMGEVHVGDLVFDERGRPTRVLFATDVQVGRLCYEIEFSDGTTIVADAEHRWLTYTDRERKSKYRASLPKRATGQGSGQQHKRVLPCVRTTVDIASTLRRPDGGANHSIPLAGALELPEAILPVDPYVFGVWLGDGHTTTARITTADQEVVDSVTMAGYRVAAHSAPLNYGVLGLEHQLRGLGLITGYTRVRSQRGRKQIPTTYQRASIAQRLALLQGLMDTDGYCSMAGICEFSSTREDLAHDVYELVCSLGIKATLRQKPCLGRTPLSSTAYTVAFTTALPVFRLGRKATRQRAVVRLRQHHRYIVDVRSVPSVPVRCIAVESPSHLFLVSRSCIPTHNTTFLRLLIQAAAGRVPCVIVDPKGSPVLEATVRAHGGIVWTLDGRAPADLLDPRPPVVAEQLLEDEDYTGNARAYGDAAHQRALWAAWALALRHEPMNLARLRSLLDRDALLKALEPYRWRDARVGEWADRLEHQQPIEEAGARDLDRVLGNLLDGVALGGSLGTGPDAIRLEDVIDTNGLVLFKLDEQQYPHATRKIAAWVLLGMGRVAHRLPAPVDGAPSALLLVDEVGALGSAARHLRGLVGRAREAGLAVVLATQGPSDLEAVDHALLSQVLQDTAWQLVFRQGSPQDARRMQELFGENFVVDESWSNDGRVTKRHVQRPRVSIDEWMNSLQPGDAWLRVAPVDRGWRQERVRVAMPRPTAMRESVKEVRSKHSVNESTKGRSMTSVATASSNGHDYQVDDGVINLSPGDEAVATLPPVPTDCPTELVDKMGADILAKCQRRWPRKHHELGPCLVWTGPRGPHAEEGPYGRTYDPVLRRTDYVHLVVWRRCFSETPIPRGWLVTHLCGVRLCERPDHLELASRQAPSPTRRSVERDELLATLWLCVDGRDVPMGCWTWQGPVNGNGYGRAYDPRVGVTRYVHRMVYEFMVGPIADGFTIDHLCFNTRCVNPRHMDVTTASENSRRRGATRGPNKRARDPAAEIQPKVGNSVAATSFAIALFERIDRTTVQDQVLDLEQLRKMLTTFQVLDDKRRGRCWSPTKYADGASSRGNAGVEAISCLVFDCDRVPPDDKRLEGVHWVGHTTWSNTPLAPRWRVVIPLGAPVPAMQWRDVWRRARAAFCPEADPSCKDPSRAYWLPSHEDGVSAKTRCHEGPLLDPSTLPAPPAERRPPGRRKAPVRGDRRANETYMAQVLAKLASAAPGGRNAALNHAAWTLGGWVAAGALDQGAVEDGLYAAAERNGLVADDGERQTWATIRSGLSKGLLEPRETGR